MRHAEIPKQRNKTPVKVLDAATISTLVNAGTSKRWRAALALAGFAVCGWARLAA